ncbi:uncharacterized protein HD556DRAFT_1249676 [Suillus plorans]|uniref:C2H2-type domain-containing protein n=1 Tax=Suillus plorans TaxID=116603 RepID=A0A9P7AAX0_9AGAM|nr:uncharacterized protein HD556DRAFT_1249676 [Suillus plorans]KAG1785541.1 hypothetical protein HD556DRAFT_1249676 [Suillus plorans]
MSQTGSQGSYLRHQASGLCIPCTKPGCNRWFKNRSGYTQHMNAKHPIFLHPHAVTQASVPCSPSPALSFDLDFGDANDTDLGPEDPLQPTAQFVGPGDRLYRNYHPLLSARPCDREGNFLPRGTPPPPLSDKASDDWTPYKSRVEFELADYLFTKNQTPMHSIDQLLNIWAASLIEGGSKTTLFPDHRALYKTIDDTPLGDIKWQSFSVKYTGEIPEQGVAPWMTDTYDVWFRDPRNVVNNMLSNPDYAMEIDLQPYREYATENDERQWQDFMSGDWAWSQADKISEDPDTHGSAFVPVILGSDKTTVSVATGQNDYYPLYASIGNVQNTVRRAHRNAVAVVGFLAMPKTTKQHAETPGFRSFRRQIFHSSLSFILKNLKPGMTKPEIVCFGDGHYRRVIYGLGPYIADYEEQVLLACIVRNWCAKCLSHSDDLDEISLLRSRTHADALIEECDFDTLWKEYGLINVLVPFTNDFPRADIHELLAPDLLHQIIKGAYKDHLVTWVEKYLLRTHGKMQANIILDDIDRRIAAVPPFPGLRRFPQGRHFKQWTGDDSKALMKVYLPAIEGHVPLDVVRAFRAFLEFCYLVRRNVITEKSLGEIQDALTRFHHYREIFKTTGTVLTFSLPRQHAMSHYIYLIRLFGAPNGLCSSITESKHIKAVKEPWRRSSRYKALGQMLLTNQRLDKLAASRVDFRTRGMLSGTCLSSILAALDSVRSLHKPMWKSRPMQINTTLSCPVCPEAPAPVYSTRMSALTLRILMCQCRIPALANELHIPDLAELVQQFLTEQLYPNKDPTQIPTGIMDRPRYDGRIRVFHSAASTFFAPSDLSGTGGMKREHIRVSPRWRNEYARKDCVFVITDPNVPGMRGMDIAQVLTFFSFRLRGVRYPCAVVRWFNRIGDTPDEDTGMWMVSPSFNGNHAHYAVIHVEAIFRSAHLIPVYGTELLPSLVKSHHVLDIFTLFYVNKYADHHAFEIAW